MISLIDSIAYVFCMLLSVCIFYNFTLGKRELYFTRSFYAGITAIFVLLWTFVLGSQYNVGTDYGQYLSYFREGAPSLIRYNREFGFVIISDFVSRNLCPQMGFYILAFIQSICFCIYLRNENFKRPDIFLLLFFCCSPAFVNSLNLLRQYTAMYFFLIGYTYLRKIGGKNAIIYTIYIFIATMFHFSSLLLLFLLPLRKFLYKNCKNVMLLIVVFALICVFLNIDNLVFFFVRFTPYKYYIKTNFVLETNRASSLNILTKLIYMPFYIFFLLSGYRSDVLSRDGDYFNCNMGILAYCAKLVGMSSFFVARFVVYFEVLSILPIYYWFIYIITNEKWKNINKVMLLLVSLLIVVGPYVLKTVAFPSAEYKYSSIWGN